MKKEHNYYIMGDVVQIINKDYPDNGQFGGFIDFDDDGDFIIGTFDNWNIINFNDFNRNFNYIGFDENIVNINTAIINEKYYILSALDGFKKSLKYTLLSIDVDDKVRKFKMSDENGNHFWARIISNKNEFMSTYDSSDYTTLPNVISLDNEDENKTYLAPQPKALL